MEAGGNGDATGKPGKTPSPEKNKIVIETKARLSSKNEKEERQATDQVAFRVFAV